VADDRDVLSNMASIIKTIESSGKLNPMQTRQLKNQRNKITQIQGLLSNRQIPPESYEKLADVVDALISQNFNLAMQINSSIASNQKLRMVTRNWLPAVKTITSLARIAYQ